MNFFLAAAYSGDDVPSYVKHILANRRAKVQQNKCLQCGKGFVSVSALAIHQRSHTGQQPYECNYCGMKFGVKSNLNRHLKSKHEADWSHMGHRSFECNHCGAKFGVKGNLNRHVRSIHGEDE